MKEAVVFVPMGGWMPARKSSGDEWVQVDPMRRVI
jgi:hypothetical protein